jgi:hypothetical protein
MAIRGSAGGRHDVESQQAESSVPRAKESPHAAPTAAGVVPARAGRGAGPARADTLRRLQRSAGNRAVGRVLARDWAIAPTVPNPPEVNLTPRATAVALRLNRVMFTDADEIRVIRDVLGISAEPAVVDEAFGDAVARYQSSYGLTPDGILGRFTSGRLSREITAESDFLGEARRGTQLRRTARRLHLRSPVSRTQGLLVHQGFVGDDMHPEGCVTVRFGDGGNNISLEYTGENSDAVNWLQFINMNMTATPPGAAGPTFATGGVATTGGPVTWSGAGATRWFVDAIPGGSPLYDVSGGANTRTAGTRIAMFDAPGGASGLPVAQAFAAAGGAAAGATTVRLRMNFAAYVVRANRARYRVDWTGTTTYNITAGTASAIRYSGGGGRRVTGLPGVHRTALLAEYPGNAIN